LAETDSDHKIGKSREQLLRLQS